MVTLVFCEWKTTFYRQPSLITQCTLLTFILYSSPTRLFEPERHVEIIFGTVSRWLVNGNNYLLALFRTKRRHNRPRL